MYIYIRATKQCRFFGNEYARRFRVNRILPSALLVFVITTSDRNVEWMKALRIKQAASFSRTTQAKMTLYRAAARCKALADRNASR